MQASLDAVVRNAVIEAVNNYQKFMALKAEASEIITHLRIAQLSPGIDWSRCSKTHIAPQFAIDIDHKSFKSDTLDLLSQRFGMRDW